MKIRLSLLGTTDLRSPDGHQLQSVLQQPRRFALLAYLAITTRSSAVRRDTIIGVFWPDVSQEKARGSLNQAIHQLRRSLGASAILSLGTEEVSLNRELISCDAAEFLDAIEGNLWKEAAELYRGELLPGFIDTGSSPNLDQWISEERDHFRRLATTAAWHLAEEAARLEDIPSSIVWARRASEWSEGEEETIRRLMLHLNRLGDRAGVVQAYESLVRELEQIDVAPAPETVQLFEKLRESWNENPSPQPSDTLPAQLAVSVTAQTGGVDEKTDANQNKKESAGKNNPRRIVPGLRSIATTALLAMAFLTFWGLKSQLNDGQSVTESSLLLIHPVEDFTRENLPVGAITAEIVRQLQKVQRIDVVFVADSTRPVSATANTFHLRAGVMRVDERLRLTAHLTDANTGKAIGSTRIEVAADNTLNVVDELAVQVASYTRKRIGDAIAERKLRESAVSNQAIALVSLGQQDRDRADSLRIARVYDAADMAYRMADSIFQEAEKKEPHWALPTIERARTAYKRMWLEISVAQNGRERARHWAETGVAHANRVLAKDKGHLDALELRAILNYWRWHFAQPTRSGQTDELLAQAQRDAQQVTSRDPTRALAWRILAITLHTQGDHEASLWALERAISADAFLQNDTEITLRIFTEATDVGDYAKADYWCQVMELQNPTAWFTFYCRLTLLAMAPKPPSVTEIDRIRDAIQERNFPARINSHLEALIAAALARGGDTDRAIAMLEHVSTKRHLNPELGELEAWGWLLVGDTAKARSLLESHIAASPSERKGLARIKRFEGLGLRTN